MIYLPKSVLNLLQNPSAQCRHTNIGPIGTSTTFAVANTGATNHMLPNKVAFILYTPILGSRVCMGNNSFASIARKGSAIISLNSKKILICNCLHIPDLRNPLYSLHISASVDAGTFACMALGCMYSSLASSLKSPQPPTATSGIILWDVYEAWQTLTTFSQNTHHRLQPLQPLSPHQSQLNLITPILTTMLPPSTRHTGLNVLRPHL